MEYMAVSFSSTSNMFVSLSRTAGLYNGAASREEWSAHDANVAVKKCSEVYSVVITLYELRADMFSGLADSCEQNRCPMPLINALGRVEVSVLSLPSRVRSAVTKVTAVWSYNNVHFLQSSC